MTLTAYTIDDEEHALAVLEIYIGRTPGVVLAGSFTNPLIALQEISTGPPPHLLFVDIDMPELNGLELAGMIRNGSKIIFTTSHREYGPEAYALAAADYLLKPISYERFLDCIQKMRSVMPPSAESFPIDRSFFVKSGNKGKQVKIIPEEVLYIEAAQNYMHIVSNTGRVTTYMSITELQQKFPATLFIRVHKSFLININRINSLEKAIIRMDDQSAIPLGRAFRNAFFSAIPGFKDSP